MDGSLRVRGGADERGGGGGRGRRRRGREADQPPHHHEHLPLVPHEALQGRRRAQTAPGLIPSRSPPGPVSVRSRSPCGPGGPLVARAIGFQSLAAVMLACRPPGALRVPAQCPPPGLLPVPTRSRPSPTPVTGLCCNRPPGVLPAPSWPCFRPLPVWFNRQRLGPLVRAGPTPCRRSGGHSGVAASRGRGRSTRVVGSFHARAVAHWPPLEPPPGVGQVGGLGARRHRHRSQHLRPVGSAVSWTGLVRGFRGKGGA